MGTSGIQEKVVVVTGASSGLGESTAKLLARHGARVVLGARRKERIDGVVKEISASGGNAVGFAVDVTKRVEVEALIKGAVECFSRIDVLVNNASIMPIAPISLLKVEEWDRQIDINIKGVLYGVAAVLPQMQKRCRMRLSRKYAVPHEFALLYEFLNSLDLRHFQEHGSPHKTGDEIATVETLMVWMRDRKLLDSDRSRQRITGRS